MIIRRHHTANFTTIGNALFDDPRLKLDEVGILSYLLSRPDNWEVRRPALMRRWNIGKDALRRIIINLVRHGWATACRKRLENGTYYTVYEIRDEHGPSLNDEELKRAFSLESSDAADEIEGNETDFTMAGYPPWNADDPPIHGGLPATADPPRLYKKTNPDSVNDRMGDARASAFTDGSKALTDAFWKALGFETTLQIPPEFAGVDWRAVKWEQAGWTVDLIDTETRRFASDQPPKPLTYFEKVFATAFAKRQAPLPITDPIRRNHAGQHGNIIQAADRLNDAIAGFDAGPNDVEDLRSEARPAPVRLLSQG